ncbi:transcription factor Tfb4 [Wolfiporia cocos MD-104 SS10]|uniref:General transcription and DNA repair factor IIH subunit TFB4 n=1 Tax=Wolfiporia cocos (strain MD-104) TaxID=742152 RepID=A0A2H3K401_WOLCO|nr:transcription factor Tfb4 [Wolfiporia cocos MD-104 SS10]
MDRASHLSTIVDLSPAQWTLSGSAPKERHSLDLQSFLSQLLIFLNSHVACKDQNTLAIFGALPGRSVMLYPSTTQAAGSNSADANTYRPFKVLDSTVIDSLSKQVEALDASETEAPVGLVGALTKALCYINRVAALATENDQTVAVDPRILILSVSPDQSASYIPIMNSIFSAQKLKVTIDVCKVYGPDSVFLQQAAHLTGGSYIHLDRPDALLQYLTMSFLPPPSIRQLLAVPTQDKVDFRAACFCHKRIVDIGFVCSVCLSIFCQPVPVCSTCRTKFPIKTLQRLNAARPTILTSAATPTSGNASTFPSSTTNRVATTNGNGPNPNGVR